ncbi:MAG: hypothetical protein K0Q70_162 [Rhodospirillales bacterium]|jgi:hypothetical protein|nr:hypothetical protein [Rhodospirillales bacterium]
MIDIDRRGLFAAGTGLAVLGAAGSVAAAEMPKPGPMASARDFGAVGDGNADDTAAIQRAFESAFSDPNPKIVTIPPGRYRITRPIRVQTINERRGNVTHRSGIMAQGAQLISSIEDGSPVIELKSLSTVRYFLIEGLQIKGSGRDGHGLLITCRNRGKYFYNFCLRDIIVEGCGGDGCHLIGNIFEGQIFNSYFRDNKGNGATFSHGEENTVLSAVHVFGCVFGQNGRHGVEMVKGAVDVGFYGSYFLLNKNFGLSATQGCTLLSHCGFENNHQGASGFEQGDAGIRLMVGGTLIGCTAYSIYNQTHLVRAFITNQFVMIGCTGYGGERAQKARLAKLHGKDEAQVSLIGCYGGVDREGAMEALELGGRGAGARFGARWNSSNLAQLGDYSLWVDGQGKLRMKRGKPSGDADGNIVGT